MPRMAPFYWRLLRGTPGHVRKTWASGVFWITVALGIIGAFNPLWVTWIKDTWKGISPMWGVGLAATAVVLRIAHENMFGFEQLERELSALKEARPQADLKLIERNNRVCLEIHNPGASAKFRTVLTLKGVNQNPTKNLFAKWDHLMNGGAVAEIAKGRPNGCGWLIASLTTQRCATPCSGVRTEPSRNRCRASRHLPLPTQAHMIGESKWL
jgi:hypothetical protein